MALLRREEQGRKKSKSCSLEAIKTDQSAPRNVFFFFFIPRISSSPVDKDRGVEVLESNRVSRAWPCRNYPASPSQPYRSQYMVDSTKKSAKKCDERQRSSNTSHSSPPSLSFFLVCRWMRETLQHGVWRCRGPSVPRLLSVDAVHGLLQRRRRRRRRGRKRPPKRHFRHRGVYSRHEVATSIIADEAGVSTSLETVRLVLAPPTSPALQHGPYLEARQIRQQGCAPPLL
ncbi:hypothetical protein HDK90DRAFT_129101 [Phyllosticta capitalensis]|uniref:Uncharacterized protein n=1 Tax=Phyllosticta capitalensis TaxID=121624 RepID=A0ABR1YY91_9PEZI